ncbi:MAG: hypothetical protein B7Y45_13685 [Sphingomonas sp. 28-66-16]|nr:MAG: hypothetical protein B7Y45_13685 [Sphingomonas sp. 28-66-16]
MAATMLGGCIPQDGRRAPPGYDPAPERRPLFDPPRGQQPPDRALPRPQPWEARTVTPDASTVDATDYTVVAGDTLRGIANKTGAGSEAIARANGLSAPFTIYAGQRLHIPGGRYHLVRSGETGIAIARAYGVDWSRIVAENELVEPYILRAGQRIVIPHAGPLTPAERAAAFHLNIDDIVTGGEPALATNAKPVRSSPSSSRILPPDATLAEPARRTGAFAWPVNGTVIKRFGPGASGERNDGIKIAVPLDTPVLAAADGVVAYTGDGVAGLGGLVMVKHGDGWTSVYGHTGQILVQRGQSVKRGQTIALSGDSGFADRPELHFEIRKGRTPVDPLVELPARR